MLAYLKSLVDRTNPNEGHTAVLIVTCVVLTLSIVALMCVICWTDRSLPTELGILVGGLTGLSGVALGTARRNTDS